MIPVIADEDFASQMDREVLPFLKRYRKDFVIQVNGGDLACSRYLLEEPKGQIVISHGFTESKEKYNEVIYYFLKAGFSVWILDHCGHGYSYRLNTDPSLVHIDTFKRYSQDLLTLARKARFENPHVPMFLYCHSMGGAIGILAAEHRPDYFKALILSSPMIKPQTGPLTWRQARNIAGTAQVLGRGEDYVITQGPYEGDENFENSCDTSQPRFEWYAKKRRENPELQTNAASYDWFRAAAQANKDMYRNASKLTMPVLLIQAYKDSVVDTQAQMDFLSHLDGAPEVYLNIMKNVKHEIFNSKQQELELYWKCILTFLNEHLK